MRRERAEPRVARGQDALLPLIGVRAARGQRLAVLITSQEGVSDRTQRRRQPGDGGQTDFLPLADALALQHLRGLFASQHRSPSYPPARATRRMNVNVLAGRN